MRAFGCICYIHLPSTMRIELKAQPGILLGYALRTKCYRVYDSNSNKMRNNRDVVFDE